MPKGTNASGTGELDTTNPDALNDDTNSVDNNAPDSGGDNQSDGAAVTGDTQALKQEIKTLKSRIGSLAQANDQRIKEINDEWTTWGENYRKWAAAEIDSSYRKGKEEAEDKLLPLLPPEDKSAYFEGSRQTEKQRRDAAVEAAKRSEAKRAEINQALSEAINSAIEQGVPQNQLDTTSPQTVVASVAKYFSKAAAPKDEFTDELKKMRQELDDATEELDRLRRDGAGESRTSTVSSGTTAERHSAVEYWEGEMAKAQRKHSTVEFLKARRERDAARASL